MDIYEPLFSTSCVLNEQIARQVFDILPERGPVVAIIDKDNHCWPNDSEKFANLHINESFIRDLCEKINDGVEPVISEINECSIVVSQLSTERTNCGYVMIALPKYNAEATLANMDLVEIVLNQISLIAKLIEKNNLLYELQIKHCSIYGQGRPSN
jgi:hypothetical protein